MNMSRKVYSVRQLSTELKNLLETGFRNIWVEGELISLTCPLSGHIYFSLKEGNSTLKCVYFKNRQTWNSAVPQQGKQVLVQGQVSVYEPRGDLQLIVSYMEEAGEGALRLAFEQLKKRLLAEGLFDQNSKKPLPAFPAAIGLITSRSGAVFHDMLVTLARRFPLAKVLLYPVAVQGASAPSSIINMLKLAAKRNEVDVIILARGGGSPEDLLAFNDEDVARTVYQCKIPIVSAVGHETDFSIADFVADVRAPTPTGAAQLVSPDATECKRKIVTLIDRLLNLQTRKLQEKQQYLDFLTAKLTHPRQKLQMLYQTRYYLTDQLMKQVQQHIIHRKTQLNNSTTILRGNSPTHHFMLGRQSVQEFHTSLVKSTRLKLAGMQELINQKKQVVRLMGPEKTLLRGYAFVQDESEKIVTSPADINQGDLLKVSVAGGQFAAVVK